MYFMSEKQKYQLKKILDNNSKEQGGVKLISRNYEKDTTEEIFILYKIWPGEKIADGKEHLVTIFFDQEDFESGCFRTHNDMKQFGDCNTTDIASAIDDELGYIKSNFRGWDNSENIDFEAIDPELLKGLLEDDNVQKALQAQLQFVDEAAPEVPSKNVNDFIKDCKTIDENFGKLVVSFTQKMIKEFDLDFAKFDYEIIKSNSFGYYIDAYFFFNDGFNFKWARSNYGNTDFSIQKNTPISIKMMKKDIGLKEWRMGQSYQYISKEAFNSYRNFAQRIIDRGRGNWKVSLDLEE